MVTAVPFFLRYTPRATSVNEIPEFERSVVSLNSSGAAILSDIGLWGAVAAPFVLNGLYHGEMNEAFWHDNLVYAQVISFTAALTGITKAAFRRPRPRTYAGDPDYVNSESGFESFYSGHAAMAAAALASTAFSMNLRKQGSTWPWVVAAGTGAAISIARVAAGMHFYSDVLVGLGVGTAVGILVPWLHSQSAPESALYFTPQEGGATALWVRHF